MASRENITNIIGDLEKYVTSEQYAGYDPYDILNAPLFSLPLFRSNKLVRFSAQQVFRRVPFNMRSILGINKEINPVTLGLCIQAYCYLENTEGGEGKYTEEISFLLDKLIVLSSKGYSGYCWGYNFDWESRYAKIPKFMPTIVATGIITNGLFEYYQMSKDPRIPVILKSSTDFVLKDLNRTYEGNNFSFSYSPIDNQKVFNATMKGARLLSQVYSITNESILIEEAEKTVKFTASNQNVDGSWFYSKDDARCWVDNFHSAYILDSLDEYIVHSGRFGYKENLEKGLNYYLSNFFTESGFPKYYSNSFYPIDATECAQSIITLTRFGFFDKANDVVDFAIDRLYSKKGYFYYQRHRVTDKTPFIRWSIGWFLLALSMYLKKSNIK